MDKLDLNGILDMVKTKQHIKGILDIFSENSKDLSIKRGIYLYGAPGIGKTSFVINLLKELNYDVIHYDAGDIRNKNIIETITNDTMANTNVLSYFKKEMKKIVIVMDEIDGMNNGDKGGINSLIKIIRPKKTKKQKTEELSNNLIICIGNYHIDKKIKELMKVCETVELKQPTPKQSMHVVEKLFPNVDKELFNNIIEFTKNDLRKMSIIHNIFSKNQDINNSTIRNIFQSKTYNEDAKNITKNLLNNNYALEEHAMIMNETDRTIVGLLWHENVIDVLSKIDKNRAIILYEKLLRNICYSDYIDRITFQKQIWLFNEMSSLIKTFQNNKLLHENTKDENIVYNPSEVRFTKVLTKYSTEYNNSLFLQNLSQELLIDKKDMTVFFLELKQKFTEEEIFDMLENHNINKLDVNRIFRYLEKYTVQ